jgi:site-specific DNA-methyltransferase (adenine-specific)
MNINYIENDIHKEILNIPDNSIDLLYSSPPYGTTQAKWDQPLNWEMLFPEIWRIMKPNGIVILHASMPFTYELLKYEIPKYHYSWKKNNSTGFFQSKFQPLRDIEEVFVYYKNRGTFNPQMVGNKFYPKRPVKHGGQHKYFGTRTNITHSQAGEGGHVGKYPTTFLEYKIRKDSTGITRTDEMMDYFIKTYSNEGDKVLDFTCHNNYCGDRCKILKRNYLGIDIKLELK